MIPDELLREALECALATLQMLDREKKGVAIPKQVRPLLRFKKLSKTGLATMRRVLEDHAEIRLAVSEGLRQDVEAEGGKPIDPIAQLWLARPEGWEAQTDVLLADRALAKRAERLAIEEKGAEKRLAATERHLERVRSELADAERVLAEERARRVEVEHRLRNVESRRQSLEQQLEEARTETRRAKQAADTAESSASDARLALLAVEEQRSVAEAEQKRLASLLDEALRARVEADERAAATPARSGRSDPGLAHAARALRDAAGALSQAAEALSAAGEPPVATGVVPVAVDREQRSNSSVGSSRRRSSRTPIPIPGGRYGDDVEVATYLLAVPGVRVIIDGYNVAMTAWPQADLESQRSRLVNAAEDLVRRVGTRVHVVFDGADIPTWRNARRLVSVLFSSAGVIADDAIRAMVADAPDDQQLVVVSSDRDLVSSVRSMGANTLSSPQFLAAIGR